MDNELVEPSNQNTDMKLKKVLKKLFFIPEQILNFQK